MSAKREVSETLIVAECWRVELRWAHAFGAPQEMTVAPIEGADPLIVARGLTAGCLREIEAAVVARSTERRAHAETDSVIRHMSLPDVNRPGRAGRDDDFYRAVVAAWHAAQDAGERAPARLIAEATGRPIDTVRGWAKEARKRGLFDG